MAKEQLFRSYLSAATGLVEQYTGKTPFSQFLKGYFSVQKKYGSRDRKYISRLCYCYYRSGHAMAAMNPEKKMIDSLFLCSTEQNELLENLNPSWNDKAGLSLEKKISLLHPEFAERDIFPWGPELSQGIEVPWFYLSHLVQPLLFLRIRPGCRDGVLSKLYNGQVLFEELGDDCLALPNATNLEKILILNKEVVVQDLNSQKTADLLNGVDIGPSASAWDCCAASGGKSILLRDRKPGIRLTVSDIRENSLDRLRERFLQAGIKEYKSFTADLATPGWQPPADRYALVLADVPCTGSGTWGRTPEQLYYFDEIKIAEYATLQKKILRNIIPSIGSQGWLLYSTCSVFKKENEEIVQYLEQEFKLQTVQAGLLKGYDKKADTLFAALLKKQL